MDTNMRHQGIIRKPDLASPFSMQAKKKKIKPVPEDFRTLGNA